MIKPFAFGGENILIESGIENLSIPAFRAFDGEVVTCWKLSLLDRVKLFFGGKVWVRTKTHNLPIHFFWLETTEPFKIER